MEKLEVDSTVKNVKIYGYSDDIVSIEGSDYIENEIDCFDRDVRIWFDDGTVILISYGKESKAIWKICVENRGVAQQNLTVCDDESSDIYSDIFEIDAEVVKHRII